MSQTSALETTTTEHKMISIFQQHAQKSELEYSLVSIFRPAITFCYHTRIVLFSMCYLFIVHFLTLLRAALTGCTVLVSLIWLMLSLCLTGLHSTIGHVCAFAPRIIRCRAKARLLKRKFEMELSGFMFGPVGNGIALVTLWPGWLVILATWGTFRLAVTG